MDEVTAIMEIEYAEPKASLLLPNDSRSWTQILTRDLTRLGCPHPKKINVVLVAPGRLSFLWDTYVGSQLYENLQNASKPGFQTRELLSM
ncbi:hypothetical protein BD779DRAFT_125854 [Infundibulicybe gibba]|nr:hypothetical protein BD779DRAFT_125854 [Infundibulicybe gibba]